MVHPRRWGEGIDAALMLTVFASFKLRGKGAVELKVKGGNAGAVRFYLGLGMEVVGGMGAR